HRQKTDIFAMMLKIQDNFANSDTGGPWRPPLCGDWSCSVKHAIGTDKSFRRLGVSDAPYKA
ncbi:hypothetical protein, partial [Rhizobium nepotum]|uniref:hypothetical protein n=1 Tax=Rhizobium nepotum TaxID=1035271 RepID=UPI001AEBFE63